MYSRNKIVPLLDQMYKNLAAPSLGRAAPASPYRFASHVVSERMRQLEIQKYEALGHEANFVTTQGYNVLYVKSEGNPTTTSALDKSHQLTLSLRKLSIINGILNMLSLSKTYLTNDDEKRNLLEENLLSLINSSHHESDEDIETFINQLMVNVQDILGTSAESGKKILRDIRNAERYFVAEYNQKKVIVNETFVDNEVFLQIDIPFGNKLTEEQKKEYLRIHQPLEKPEWFTELKEWEQEWLLPRIPPTLDGDWTPFENLFQSSAMQHLPGIKNARTNFLVKKDADDYTILSSSFKCSSLVTYEMHADDKKHNTELNANQLTDILKKEVITPNAPIFIGSLLSDVIIGGGSDNDLTRLQSVSTQKSGDALHAPLISGNDPVNFLRMMTPATGVIAEAIGRWDHVDQALALHASNVNSLIDPNKSIAFEAAKKLSALREITFSAFSDRNLNAHKTAYLSILIETMGGVVSTNCKSGKDRTGLDELYRAAMLIYFNKYNELPDYADNKERRQLFINIYVDLFNSYKTQEAAAGNTPGSFGLKDTAKMLCSDIVNAIDASYKISNKNANLNKPSKFIKDEESAMKERMLIATTRKNYGKDIDELLPYLERLQADVKIKIYENPAITMQDYGKFLSKTNEALAYWWQYANPGQKIKMQELQAENQFLFSVLDGRQRNPANNIVRKIISFSDKSEELKSTPDKTLQEIIEQEIKGNINNALQDNAMLVVEAGNTSGTILAKKLTFSEITNDTFARKNTTSINNHTFTTIQHADNKNNQYKSHLLYESASLATLSKKQMAELAVKQVEDFRALSQATMHFNGDMTNKYKAAFTRAMAKYCESMNYPYVVPPTLKMTLAKKTDFTKQLDKMSKSNNSDPTLFKYKHHVENTATDTLNLDNDPTFKRRVKIQKS